MEISRDKRNCDGEEWKRKRENGGTGETKKRRANKEIAFLVVQVSERLTRDYQALYRKYKGDRAYKNRLDEILALNSVDREPCKRGRQIEHEYTAEHLCTAAG